MSQVLVKGEVLLELEDGDTKTYAFSSAGDLSTLEGTIDSAIEELGSIQRNIEKKIAQAEMLADDEEIEA